MPKYRNHLSSHISFSVKVWHNIQWPILVPVPVPFPHKFCLNKPSATTSASTYFYAIHSSWWWTATLATIHCVKIRMHSSRMRTGRSLTVLCRSLLPGGGGCLLREGGGGCLLHGGLLLGGVYSGGGGLLLGGLLPGGLLVGGGGWYPSMHWGRPPVDRITDACKNITLAHLRCCR